jgi:hypothetical protein
VTVNLYVDVHVRWAITDLELIATVAEPSDMENRVEYLPL